MLGYSPRVKSSMLPEWIGKTVRLPCHLVKFNDDGTLTVRAMGDGHVIIKDPAPDSTISENYIEILGEVIDATTILKTSPCIQLGPGPCSKYEEHE